MTPWDYDLIHHALKLLQLEHQLPLDSSISIQAKMNQRRNLAHIREVREKLETMEVEESRVPGILKTAQELVDALQGPANELLKVREKFVNEMAQFKSGDR